MKLAEINDGDVLGLTGFGANGYLVLKAVNHLYPHSKVMVFARNPLERKFALETGAYWAGDTDDKSPEECRSIIDTTQVWKPVVEAMMYLKPDGILVINTLRKEEIDKVYLLKLDYGWHL